MIPLGRRRTVVASGGGRLLHVEVRVRDQRDERRLLSLVEAVEGVSSAELSGSGWLVVRLSPAVGDAGVRRVAGAVDDAERDCPGLPRLPADRPELPADSHAARREAVALVADGLGAAAAVAGRVARLPRLPVDLLASLPFVQSEPRVRAVLDGLVGRGPAELALVVANAAAGALTQGPFGLIMDGALRLALLAEARARAAAWGRLADGIVDAPPRKEARRDGADRQRRTRLHAGPVDVHSRRSGIAAVAGGPGAALAFADVRRGAATIAALTPRPARFGREAFAAHVGRLLAARGMVCVDSAALRRLDRIDTILLDVPDAELGGDAVRRLVAAAHAAEMMVAIASADEHLVAEAGGDLRVEGGEQTVASLHMLQADGCGVVAVSPDADVLSLADLGVGRIDPDDPVPWGAATPSR